MYTPIRVALAASVAAAMAGGPLTVPAGAARIPGPAKPSGHADDFDSGGFRDHASSSNQGFTVTYGTAGGPGSRKTTITRDSPGIPGHADVDYEPFGTVMAAADFNGDGFAGLAVGDETEKAGGHTDRGSVTMVWGSRTGIGTRATLLTAHRPRTGRHFGSGLATGDFNGDGKADLAVTDTKNVYIYRGAFSTNAGHTGPVTRHRSPANRPLDPLPLAAGRVTGGRATDLHVLGEGRSGKRRTSVAWLLKGVPTVKPATFTTYSSTQSSHLPQGVVADFDRNGHGDLAVNDPDYLNRTGALLILRGSKSGASAVHRITRATTGVATSATKDDLFGATLSAGDTNKDGYPDPAVAAVGEQVGKAPGAGGVHILRGSSKGLTGTKSQWFTRATTGVPRDPKQHTWFGSFTRLRDTNADGYADLVVSEFATVSRLLLGAKTGITTRGTRELKVSADFIQ